jgi:hypothetical protein
MLALAAVRDTVRNGSILWKRRYDPGLPAALPFIHGFRPNSITSFWRVGPPAPTSEAKVETNAHYRAIKTNLPALHFRRIGCSYSRHWTAQYVGDNESEPVFSSRSDRRRRGPYSMTFLLAIALAGAKAAVAFDLTVEAAVSQAGER